MSKTFNNKLYYPLLLVLFGLVSSLNANPKLLVCACVYVFIALTANTITELYGKKEALLGVLGCVLVNMIVTWKGVNLLLIGSFSSVIVSTYCGISLFTRLKPTTNFHARNFVTLTTAALVDSVIMPSVLLMKFSATKCLSIALNDMIYKSSYSVVIALSLVGISYLVKQGRKLMYISE